MEADGTEFSARLVRYDGEKIDRLTIGDEGTALAAKKAVEEGRFTRRLGRDQAADAQPAAALHHLDAAAGGGAQARLLGEPDDAGRAEPLRGRRDHLHAHRRRADGARGDLGGARARSPTATTPATCRTSRAITRPRPRTRRKRTRRSGRPISRRDRAGSGDHARLYELIWKRALASQMASARLERTTAELADGTGRHALRATGQVVLFPGFLALYEEGRDDEADEESRRLPRLARGRHAGQEGGRGRAAFHPAAAALFRGEPGQADGGARHRPALHLCRRRCRR